MSDTLDSILAILLFASVIGIFAAKIWLYLTVSKESRVAAILTVIVPFLWIGFARSHWDAAKGPIKLWLICLAVLVGCGIIAASTS